MTQYRNLEDIDGHIATFLEPSALDDAIERLDFDKVDADPDQITGVVETINDGEVEAVWITETTRPFMSQAKYRRIE